MNQDPPGPNPELDSEAQTLLLHAAGEQLGVASAWSILRAGKQALVNPQPHDPNLVEQFKVAAKGKSLNPLNLKSKPRSKTGEQLWLETDKLWKNKVGKGWVAKKVLGKGGFGVVGHWTYEGSDKAQRAMNDVAVKQTVKFGPAGKLEGMDVEAAHLLLLAKSKSPHIVRMYRRLYEEQGNRTFKMDIGKIHRIFLEFCPGGDLSGWIQAKLRGKKEVRELELWSIFHCLARGVRVLHCGKEASSEVDLFKRAIVHFDLKLQNILIGSKLTDSEHRNDPPFKIADFGLAITADTQQNDDLLKKHSLRGTMAFLTPEQVGLNHVAGGRPWAQCGSYYVKARRYDTPSNIWQLGLILYCLMRNIGWPPRWQNFELRNSNLSPRLIMKGKTIGIIEDINEEEGKASNQYSKEFRALVFECLLVSPSDRVPIEELVEKTFIGLECVRMATGTHNFDEVFDPYQEPHLSDRWYSGQERASIPDPLLDAAREQRVERKTESDLARPERTTLKKKQAQSQLERTAPTVIPAPNDAVKMMDEQRKYKPHFSIAYPRPPIKNATTQLQTPLKLTSPRIIPTVIPDITAIFRIEKPGWLHRAAIHKNYKLSNIADNTQVIHLKVMLERLNCGLKASEMVIRIGNLEMMNSQQLGEFRNVRVVRVSKQN